MDFYSQLVPIPYNIQLLCIYTSDNFKMVYSGITPYFLAFYCTGDILVFMPGQEDIEVTCELLSGVYSFLFHMS